MFLATYIFFLNKVSVKDFGPFLNQEAYLMSFKSCLYILDNSPFSDMSFVNYFLPFCGLSSDTLHIHYLF